jgi:DNA-binding GntR family transcriptional regulator
MSRPDLSLPLSLPEHIRRLVEADIVTGILEPHTRVTEEHLAKRYSVSRTPIREAMRLLENQGLLVRRKGPAVYVAARTTRDEVEVIYRVRQSVESFLTEKAASEITEDALDKLQAIHDEFRQRLSNADTKTDIATLVSLDSQFHWGIYDLSGSDLTGIVNSYWGRHLRELAKRVYESSPPAIYAGQHGEILDALKQRDAALARRLMKHHLKESSDAILATYVRGRSAQNRRPQ